jgi:cytochrome c oxidase subunit IV
MQRHPLNLVSLVFGLAFVVVGVPFLLDRPDVLFGDWSWGWPLLAIAVGAALLLSSRRDRG